MQSVENTPRHFAPPVDDALFREAMSRVAASVHVIATDGPAGLAGMTATAVQSVSDAPPTLLCCLNMKSRTRAVLQANGAFSVNVLAADQEDASEIFAGRRGLEGAGRFAPLDFARTGSGQPALSGALAVFDCHIAEAEAIGSHLVVFGHVKAITLGTPGPALVYRGRAYHGL